MSMPNKGLLKLSEECSELAQVSSKQAAYISNPDRFKDSIIEEMGDVLAAITFVMVKLNIDPEKVKERKKLKLGRYQRWDKEP